MTAEAFKKFAQAADRDAAGDYLGAERLLSAAVEIYPNWPEGLLNLGVARKRSGNWDGAVEAMRAAHKLAPLNPIIRYNLGVALLDLGNYKEGLPLFESRSSVPELRIPKPNLPFSEWRGEDLLGKRLVIWPDQGFGDQIQSARFAPVLAAQGAEVTLICAPALTKLFENSFEVSIIPAKGSIEFPDPDFWALGLSLPYRTGVQVDSIPNGPYLKSPVVQKSDFRVGIATKGAKGHANDRNRSMDPISAAQLMRTLGGAIDLSPENTGAANFADTAAIVAGLDLVITVDTSVAHLAGAMGKPVWIMLPSRGTDWRWMRDRTDSPWYPSARLFRQKSAGSWTEVIEQISNAYHLL